MELLRIHIKEDNSFILYDKDGNKRWYYVTEGTPTLMAKDQIACRKNCMPEDIFRDGCAEIIKTVIIHNLEELAILGIVVIIRALLSVVIHWEMRLEEKENAKHEKENIK